MRLVLAGFGVVGQSFAELLAHKQKELAGVYGLVPRVVAIVDSAGSVTDERGLDIARVIRSKRKLGSVRAKGEKRTTAEIIRQTEADVMVETTPTDFKTGEPGLGHMRAAFISKKSVITCNKGPLGVAFHALGELARHNSVQFRYSGAVGGGTPILDFGRTCSTGDEITKVTGILNGTCNFILTKMESDGLGFGEALALAQKEGYAETDPTASLSTAAEGKRQAGRDEQDALSSRRRSTTIGAGGLSYVSQCTGSASCRAIHPGRTDHNSPSTLEGTRQLRAREDSAALLIEATPRPVRKGPHQRPWETVLSMGLWKPAPDAPCWNG